MVFVAVGARPAQRVGVRAELLHLKNVLSKRHIAQPAQNLHRRHEKRPAMVQVVSDRVLVGRLETRVVVEAVVDAPHHNFEGAQIIRSGRMSHLADVPHFVAYPGPVERVGIDCHRDLRAFIVRPVRIGVHQQQGLGRHGDEAEQTAAVVVRRDVARFIDGNDQELVGRTGAQIDQFQLVSLFQNAVGGREREQRICAVADDGGGGFIAVPGNHHFAEPIRDRDIG